MEFENNWREESFLFDHAAVGMALVEAASERLVRVNGPFCMILGYGRAELESLAWPVLVRPKDMPRFLEEKRRLDEGVTQEAAVEARFVRKDGTRVWGSATVSVFRLAESAGMYYLIILQDISLRKQAEKALRESEALVRSVSDHLPDAMLYQIIRLPDGSRRFTFVSEAVQRFYGCTPEEAMADPGRIYGRVLPEDAERVYREEEEAFHAGRNFTTEARLRTPGGGVRWSYFASSPRSLEDGSTCWDGIELDITGRKRNEEALRALSARQEALLAAIPDIVMEVDENRVYRWANRAGREFFGDDVVGQDPQSYFVSDMSEFRPFRPVFEGSEEVAYVECWHRRRDGQKRLLATWGRVLKSASGEVTGALFSSRDITDLRDLQERFLQSQKMESIGRLAGGIAHDFNNSLQVILGCADLALETTAPGHSAHDYLASIRLAAKHSADLTRQLLAFSRRQAIRPQVVGLNEIVENMRKMLQRLVGEEVDLQWAAGEDLWPVRVDPAQIEQALTNLTVNARDAFLGAGRLCLSTRNVTHDSPFRVYQQDADAGRYVLLEVADNGRGIEAEVLPHIFEPFFTTKEFGSSAGLGLPTVYGIVQQNRGFLDVESGPGRGTTFRLYFPRAEAPPGA